MNKASQIFNSLLQRGIEMLMLIATKAQGIKASQEISLDFSNSQALS